MLLADDAKKLDENDPLNRGFAASYVCDGTDFIAIVGPHGKIVNGPLENVPQPDVIVQL